MTHESNGIGVQHPQGPASPNLAMVGAPRFASLEVTKAPGDQITASWTATNTGGPMRGRLELRVRVPGADQFAEGQTTDLPEGSEDAPSRTSMHVSMILDPDTPEGVFDASLVAMEMDQDFPVKVIRAESIELTVAKPSTVQGGRSND